MAGNSRTESAARLPSDEASSGKALEQTVCRLVEPSQGAAIFVEMTHQFTGEPINPAAP